MDIMHLAYGKPVQRSFNARTALIEASRCLLCHDAPCSAACPAGTDPGRFIRSLRLHNVKGAIETVRENNPLAGSCADVCPCERLCEGACSRSGIDVPIAIGRLQAYLVAEEKALGMHVRTVSGPPTGYRIACVGAGPASLACAAELAAAGCKVTVFEAAREPGGVLNRVILPSRLHPDVVRHDIRQIAALGVSFVCDTWIGPERLQGLASEYDAVFMGIGLWRSRRSDIPGMELCGVHMALEYLEQARTEHKRAEGVTLVIGGGDVAMDCAVTACQLGADTTIVYRRSIAEAPSGTAEMECVRRLGIPLFTGFAPVRIVGEEGRVSGMEFVGRDGYGRLTLKADRVIWAIGQERDPAFVDFVPGARIFAGGDCVNGGKTVVEAVAEGKAAARSILDALVVSSHSA